MIKIGITGGIGAGKSYVCNLLQAWGIPIYDCDSEAKKITATSPTLRTALTQLVGKELYANNQFQKHILARYLFASQEHANKVNALIHPAVKEDFKDWCQRQKTYLSEHALTPPIVALESAILFESGFHDVVDYTLLVTAPEPLRIQRAMTRDGSTEEQVRARIAMQMSEEEKSLRANFTLINDGRKDLVPILEQVLRSLSK